MDWVQCKIFISSTFRDMYYEREYLAKQVFYELKAWCHERRILLSEIDLRWGITEWMAREEHSTILKCLNGVDESRPFFLCFLGQYRGWMPKRTEISDPTFVLYPALEAVLGKRSATEMEIYQAIDGSNAQAVFFRRSPSYLETMPPELRKVYTNESLKDEDERKTADKAVSELAEVILPGRGCRPIAYSASYKDRILTDFRVDGKPLAERILHELKERIIACFPERAELPERSDFERKLDVQAGRLFMASLEYKDRGDTAALESRWSSEGGPLLLRGASGSGRSAFFSKWLKEYHSNAVYRFCDTGDSLTEVLEDICRQLGVESNGRAPSLSDTMSRLERVCAGRAVIIAMDGLEHFLTLEATQLLSVKGLKLLGTVRGDCPEGERLSVWAQEHDIGVFEVWPFTSADDRKDLVDLYLKRYLKTLDTTQMEILLKKPGTINPLFMRIVLSELRLFGSFEGLAGFLEAFGDSVESAFTAVLERLEKDYEATAIGSDLVVGVFSSLAASGDGLSLKEWELASGCAVHNGHLQMILRQIEPFMRVTISDGEAIYYFGYDTFLAAAKKRYQDRLDNIHARLYDIFMSESDPGKNSRFEGSLRALEKLFFHAKYTGNTGNLADSVFYLNSRIRRGGLYRLLQDLADCLNETSIRLLTFLQASAGSLAHWPDSFISLLNHEGGWFKEKAEAFTERQDMPCFDFDKVALPGLPARDGAGLTQFVDTGKSGAGGETLAAGGESLAAGVSVSNISRSANIVTARHFSNVFATDYASGARLIYRFEKSETIAVYDGDNPEKDPAFIRIAKGRVSSLFVSIDGCRLAVAYENGDLNVLYIRWDDRSPSWYDTVWKGRYLRPEENRPAFVWDGDSLIFQAEDRAASRLSFASGDPVVEKIMELTGDVTSISVNIPGATPFIATRAVDGAVLYNGSSSIKLDYPVSCMCRLDEGIAAATEDGTLQVYDSVTLAARRKISVRMPARVLLRQGESLYAISRDYTDGFLFRFADGAGMSGVPGGGSGKSIVDCEDTPGVDGIGLCRVTGCDELFPRGRIFYIIRAGFDEKGRFYSLTGESFHSVVFDKPDGESSGISPNPGFREELPTGEKNQELPVEICCVTDDGSGAGAIVKAGCVLYRCTPKGLKERIEIGAYRFCWLQKAGIAIGYCRINGVGLCCFLKDRVVFTDVPEVIAGGAAGNGMWLLGESGAVYRVGEDGGISAVLPHIAGRPPESNTCFGTSGRPPESITCFATSDGASESITCFGNILVLSCLDTSAARIGHRLTVFDDHGGSLERINELFFPSDCGHYQFSVIDPLTKKIYAFISKDGNTISLASGDIRSFDIRTAVSAPLPFVRSVQNAIFSNGIIYIREAGGVIHAIDADVRRLCTMEPVRAINALHNCGGSVYAESKGQLYRLVVKGSN